MSGVFIKGMEMPKGCPCELIGDGYDVWCFAVGGIPARVKEYAECCQNGTRPSWCPLIPVPDHSDLIEREPLRASIKESIDECQKWAEEVNEGEMYARVSQSLGTFVECLLRIKAAPTIIPADPA